MAHYFFYYYYHIIATLSGFLRTYYSRSIDDFLRKSYICTYVYSSYGFLNGVCWYYIAFCMIHANLSYFTYVHLSLLTSLFIILTKLKAEKFDFKININCTKNHEQSYKNFLFAPTWNGVYTRILTLLLVIYKYNL